jgi:MSHA biogenesis protein MshK
MAGHLSAGLFCLALAASPQAHAQAMSDPMRPPREILGGGDVPDTAASTSPAQVVIISSDRRQATINGRTVALGGRYGDATVVRISDAEIVLQKPDSTEVIKLYSSVNRKMRSAEGNAAERRED